MVQHIVQHISRIAHASLNFWTSMQDLLLACRLRVSRTRRRAQRAMMGAASDGRTGSFCLSSTLDPLLWWLFRFLAVYAFFLTNMIHSATLSARPRNPIYSSSSISGRARCRIPSRGGDRWLGRRVESRSTVSTVPRWIVVWYLMLTEIWNRCWGLQD